MKIKHLIPLLFLSGIFHQCTFTQDSLNDNTYSQEPENFEEGKCYAKSMMPDEYEIYSSDEYVVYTGDASEENVPIETIQVETSPASTKWVKKKGDKNCQSADPNDCLVWCLVETPAETETIKILTDTTQSTNYEIKEISKKRLARKGGFTEWREVICEGDISKSLVHQIQDALIKEGYYEGEYSNQINNRIKAALTKFQKDYNLPIGNLDFESMRFLGISVD